MNETGSQRRIVGGVWAVAMTAAVVLAFVVQPIGDWGGFGILLAVLGVLLALVGLWMLVTGSGHLLSDRYSQRAQVIISAIGLVAATLALVGTLVADWGSWTATDVLTIGIWLSIGTMFLVSLVAASGGRSADL